MPHCLTLTPRDPLISRDGRPFGLGAGNRMRSLDWLYPSVLAGSLRTLLGKQVGTFEPEKLKAVAVRGPLPLLNGQVFVPRPLDCIVREQNGRRECFAIRPTGFEQGEGWELEEPGLLPVLLPESAGDNFKPARGPGFWSCAKLAEWLADPAGTEFTAPPEQGTGTDDFLDLPAKELRVHVQMDPASGAGRSENALFVTAGLDLNRKGTAAPIRLSARVESAGDYAEHLAGLDRLHPLGGERRLVHWKIGTDTQVWTCPAAVRAALKGSTRVRMLLATPAIFERGWRPGWLRETQGTLEGTPPGTEATLRLVGAVVGRWQPLSGWSLEKGQVGPKPIRRLVPAGSVYFFEVAGGDASALEDRWLQSVCDGEQDRLDGFGLALWGTWSRHDSDTKGER